MRFVYSRKGGPLINWNRGRSPGWATGSGRSADARSLGDIDIMPKAGGPEVVSTVGDYISVGDTEPSPLARFVSPGGVLSMAGLAAGAYHGYKRNGNVRWAVGWGVLGALFPLITGGVAVAQGFGKKKGA